MTYLAVRMSGVLFCVSSAAACVAQSDEVDEATDETTSAYSGRLPTLVATSPPPGAPTSWPQPDSEGVLGQNGYCGATAAANLLGWYGLNVTPRQAIDGGCWSFIGTTAYRLATYLSTTYPNLGCAKGTLPWDADALGGLRNALARGHPVVIEFMTGALDAHWVTVVGVRGDTANPQLVVMSWGGYMTIRWEDVQDAWRNAWGGYYPHVICRAVSPLASALTHP